MEELRFEDLEIVFVRMPSGMGWSRGVGAFSGKVIDGSSYKA
jgi:hypothetical protein